VQNKLLTSCSTRTRLTARPCAKRYVAMDMKSFFLKISLLLILSSTCKAEFIQDWGLEYSSKEYCRPGTDYCSIFITLQGKGGSPIKIEAAGPIVLSVVNKQILSCEFNAYDASSFAILFNLQGEKVATIEHRGYLRQCGTTSDGKLYWFHYNKVVNSQPVNVLLVASDNGNIVFEKELTNGGEIKFQYAGKDYAVTIREPELPG